MKRKFLASAAVVIAALSMAAPVVARPQTRFGAAAGTANEGSRRVIVFALPGVDWDGVVEAETPVLDGLVNRGSVAGLVVRSATRGMTPTRGYLTLNSGQRAFAERLERRGDVVYEAGARVENGTALEAAARRYGGRPAGALVHLELATLRQASRGPDFGARFGALGDALAEAGVTRAVVSSADVSARQGVSAMRRAAVLGLVDTHGTVEFGTISGLVIPDPSAPFGVRTDQAAFEAAVESAMNDARVVLVDPGETQRADEYVQYMTPARAGLLRRQALERSDVLLGAVVSRIRPSDLLLVVAPSGPRESTTDRLTPIVAAGSGVSKGWLTSRLTRREGLVMLTEVAPTIVRYVGGRIPQGMGDAVMESVSSAQSGRAEAMAALSARSVVRDKFSLVATIIFIVLLALVAFGSFVTFLVGRHPGARLLTAGAFLVLALPPAATLVRALNIDKLGMSGGLAGLVVLTTLLSATGWIPRRRWAGGVVLLLVGFVLIFADLLRGAPWQLNGAFGYSPLLAGRFYGNGNLGYATLFTTGILGLTGLAALRGCKRAPLWLMLALAAIVVVEGFPAFGADFGGVLAGVPAVAITIMLGLGKRLRWRSVLAMLGGGAVLSVGVMAAELARPAASRTHLGGFAARVLADPGAGMLIVQRKLEANITLLVSTVWVYVIPLGVAVLLLLLARPQGVHASAMRTYPLLRAGLYGSLAAGIIGFLVNDSGVIIPGMVLAHVVPFFVLIGLDSIRAASGEPPAASAPRADPQPTLR